MTKQIRHIRTSKKGRIFLAGTLQPLHYGRVNDAFEFARVHADTTSRAIAKMFRLNTRETFELIAKIRNAKKAEKFFYR